MSHFSFTEVVRSVSLVIATLNAMLALVAVSKSRVLRRSQPDGPMKSGVNELAYIAIAIAGVQTMFWQISALQADTPLRWFSAPACIVWQGLLVVWFSKRVAWHQSVLRRHS